MRVRAWVVWAASNRTQDKAGVNKMLSHVANRMAIIEVTPDVEGWVKWASANSVHPMYLAFAQARPGIVFSDEPVVDPNKPGCTPRSFTYASEFHTLGMRSMELPTDPVTLEVVAGFIGEAAAGEFFSFCKVVDILPTYADVMDDPKKAKLPPSERLDAHYAAAQLLVHYVNEDNVNTLFEYALRLRKELQVSIARQFIDNSKGVLLNSAAMQKFIKENTALVAGTLK